MRTSAKERQRLVDDNVPFVRAVAAKIKEQLPREIEFDDLVAYGMQGLLEAAERFDARHGVTFTTFAYYRVRGSMFDGLRGMGWLPRAEYARYRFEERAAAYLQNLADREVGAASLDGEPAALFNLEEELRELSEAFGGVAAIFVTSLDSRGEDAVPTPPAPQQHVERRERSRTIRQAIDTLPEKEKRLLQLYYYEDRSLAEAGEAMGLSKSWSSRLHARAIELLKAALEGSDVRTDHAETAPPPKPRARR
ncbi:MAG TPA: sigma-70 family RNA polymerase sigma factor [Kofleriaceae bacterium]|nr:sigma-70 family RNA polymerase sigma factor [Kofleriaceae bacterium]